MDPSKTFSHYTCTLCKTNFESEKVVIQHISRCHGYKFKEKFRYENFFNYNCSKCNYSNHSKAKMLRHYALAHLKYHLCVPCDKVFITKKRYLNHLDTKHLDEEQNISFFDYENVFNRFIIRRANFEVDREKSIPMLMYLKYREAIKEELKSHLEKHNFIRVMFTLHCVFEKIDVQGEVVARQTLCITSGQLEHFTYYSLHNFKEFISRAANTLNENLDSIETTGSGMIMKYISDLDIRIAIPTFVGGCTNSEDLYAYYNEKVKSFGLLQKTFRDFSDPNSEDCFLHAVSAGILLRDHKHIDVDKKVFKMLARRYYELTFMENSENKKKLKKFEFPFNIKYAKAFENAFSHLNLAINIWTINTDDCFVLYSSQQPASMKRIDLCLIQHNHDVQVTGHFVALNNPGEFVRYCKRYIYQKRDRALDKPYLYCMYCNFCFKSKSIFTSHINACKNKHYQRMKFAKKDDVFQFDRTKNAQCKSAFIGFVDFEAKMEPVSNEKNYNTHKCENCRVGGPVRHCDHSERAVCMQVPMTFSFLLYTSSGKLVYRKTVSSDTDIMDQFFDTLEDVNTQLEGKINQFKELHMSDKNEKHFQRQTSCYICQGNFVPGNDRKWSKVRDHCHATPPFYNKSTRKWESKYLGAAHQICNLNRRQPKFIPIYIHNFMSYDSNFLLNHINSKKSLLEKVKQISGLPYNSNKFRSLTFNNFKFLDSFQMLAGSLSDLVDNLSQDKDHSDMVLLQQTISNKPDHLTLLMKKAAYPYEWVRSCEQLKNATNFPPYEVFISSLRNNENIPREHYEQGKEVFEKLKCKNMLEYTELYCELDTVLLAEVIFEFRNTIFEKFMLAIENYISLPQLAFDACLKTIERPIGKISIPTMVLMFEQNIRGGISFVNNRHEKIDAEKDESLLYIDANNLYGWAQKMYLPTGEYSWCSTRTIANLDWVSMKSDQPYGYVAEVDISFPENTHDLLDNLPLAPEHMDITYDKLSPYSQTVQNNILGSTAYSYKQRKLVTSLEPKTRYLVHYLNLKLYIQLGAQITKVHNVIKFRQEDFIKPFIELASEERAKAKTKFAQNLWKLLANSLYGKFIQDVRKYSKIIFCNDEHHLNRLLRSPYFIDCHTLSEKICLVHMRNETILLDRLYSVGFSILELSKFYMYSVWYQFIKPVFKEDAQLVLTDTDSFVIKFKNHTKHDALTKLAPIMDFSNFPDQFNIIKDKNSRKKIPGYFKDEYPTGIIQEAVGIRSKCYFLKIDPDFNYYNPTESTSHVVCKGISSSISNNFPLDLFKQCIYSDKTLVKTTMNRIRAKKRKLQTISITKRTLSSGDDKRYQTCNIHSVPYGSKYAKLDSCHKCAYNM